MEKSNFDRLLERYMKDQVSEEEKNKIEAWLDSAKTKNKKNFTWEKADEEELFRKITSKLDNIDEIVAYKPKKGKGRAISNNGLLGIAAALVLLIVASYIIWNSTTDAPVFQQTSSVPEVDKVILNDGTIVWLRKESKLTYYETQDKTERHARLTGEGLFEVTKDASRPFIIDCGEIKLKVLGTSFNLKIDKDGVVEVEVLTGKVNLSSPANKEGIDVEPNNKVIYDGKGLSEKATIDHAEIDRIIVRTEYDMRFKNEGMDQIMTRIEKKFNVTFKVDNAQLKKCTITADFTDHSLESTLQIISEVLDIEYKINGSEVVITGAGCK